LAPKLDFEPQVGGQRRSLVEQYYANIDFSSATDVAKLLHAYEEIILQLERAAETHAPAANTIRDLLRRVERDGYGYEQGRFTPLSRVEPSLITAIQAHAVALDLEGLHRQIVRLTAAAEDDPALAVGTAKELVETVCKTILEDRGRPPSTDDLTKLVKTAAKELALLPDGVPEEAKGSEVIRRVLSNLAQVAQGLAELRNLYGTGHGRSARTKGVKTRHARLAVGAAATLATFLLETHLERGAQGAATEIESEKATS
jgi:HEPN domain-containing protein